MEDDPVPLDMGLDSLVNGSPPAPFACEELSQSTGIDQRLIPFPALYDSEGVVAESMAASISIIANRILPR